MLLFEGLGADPVHHSFGIVLWEILTRKEPFAHYDDYDEFTEAVCDRHERPPIPDNCPPSLRRLMEACWCVLQLPSFLQTNATRSGETL
jgi:hypothetical protein